MKVFISHSGEKSRKVAKAFQEWLPTNIQAIRPWISEDIQKGSRWRERLDAALEETKVGIICLTQDNLDSPWILFESGSISKTKDAIVCTFLLENEPTDITGPLADFEHTKFDKTEIKKLLYDLNNMLGDSKVSQNVLDRTFNLFWEEFERSLKQIREMTVEAVSEPQKRSSDDLLAELLERVRRIEGNQAISLQNSQPLIINKESQLALRIQLDNLRKKLIIMEEEYQKATTSGENRSTLHLMRNDIKETRSTIQAIEKEIFW
jgi:hypothetical protein